MPLIIPRPRLVRNGHRVQLGSVSARGTLAPAKYKRLLISPYRLADAKAARMAAMSRARGAHERAPRLAQEFGETCLARAFCVFAGGFEIISEAAHRALVLKSPQLCFQ